MTLRAFKTI